MKLHTFSKKFSCAFGAGLTASLLISAPLAVYAQTPFPNVPFPNVPFPNVPFPGTGSNISTTPFPNVPFPNVPVNVPFPNIPINVPFPNVPFPTFSLNPDRETWIAKVAQALVTDGVTSHTARHTAVVFINVNPQETRDILASIPNKNGVALASSTGILVASTQPIAIVETAALNENSQSVSGLYDRYTQAFAASGMEETEARTTSKNLVIALAEIKNAYVAPNKISVQKINELGKLAAHANKAFPGMLKALGNNPSSEAFHQIKDTVAGLEIVEFYVKAVQDAV